MNDLLTATQTMSPSVWPLLVLGALPLVLMAMVSFRRTRSGAFVVSLVGFAVALWSVHWTTPVALPASPLLTFDGFGTFFVVVFAVAAFATTLFAHSDLQRQSADNEEFYMLLATATLGAAVLVCADHLASFVLGLEIMSISLYGMIAYPERGNAPIEASLKYLVLSGVGTATLLFGMALLYAACGSMSFRGIGATFVDAGDQTLMLLAHSLIFVGVAFKLSLVPFHMWTPDVYEGAPAPVTGFLASVAKASVLAVFLRYLHATGALSQGGLLHLIAILGVASMVIGNLLALQQRNVKRLLAYSSIAHLGYLMIVLPVLTAGFTHAIALQAAAIYLAVYALTTVGAFGVVGLVSGAEQHFDNNGRHDLLQYRGLLWRRPMVASAFIVLLMSLAGLPLTAGFITKLYLLNAGVQGQAWMLVFALLVGSAIGVYYYVRLVIEMVAGSQLGALSVPPRSAPAVSILIAVIALVVFGLGVYPSPLLDSTTAFAALGI